MLMGFSHLLFADLDVWNFRTLAGGRVDRERDGAIFSEVNRWPDLDSLAATSCRRNLTVCPYCSAGISCRCS